MALGDPPPGETGWRIGVAPLEPNQPPSRFLRLAHCGVSTSGDAWQFVEIDGRRYSHIVDPRTGIGLTQRSSVTVIASNGMAADGLATAASVLGSEKGLELIERTCGAACLMVVVEGQKPRLYESSGWKKHEISDPLPPN
jgi:thiamine biosynthesis lipoprotein